MAAYPFLPGTIDMQDSNVICICGFDESRILKLKTWLGQSKEHYLVFLDEEESLLFRMSLPSQVRLFILKPETEEEVFRKIAWEFLYLPFAYEAKTEKGKETLARLADVQAEVHYFASDFADQGDKLFRNIKANLSLLSKAKEGGALQGAFQGTAAIICGAGPSLVKNASQLRELSDHALILAGGAAICALNQLEVRYHFGAQVDHQSSHDLRTRKAPCKAPLFCQLRTDSELLSTAEGPLLLMDGAGNYPLEKWGRGNDSSFDGGWTVGTFCTKVAMHLGCSPIIFVGLDLSCSKNAQYAVGIEKKCLKERLLPVKNKKGEALYSQRDWLFAAKWIEQAAKTHPNIRFLNATEGGLGFQGIEDIPLKEVSIKEKFSLAVDLNARPAVSEAGKARLEELKQSLTECQTLVQGILKEMETIFPKPPSQSGKCALLERELSEQVATRELLEPLWKIWKHPIARNINPGEYSLFVNQLLFYRTLIGNHLR